VNILSANRIAAFAVATAFSGAEFCFNVLTGAKAAEAFLFQTWDFAGVVLGSGGFGVLLCRTLGRSTALLS